MRTVKDIISPGDIVLLLNTTCLPDVFLRALQLISISMSQTPQAPGASVATIWPRTLLPLPSQPRPPQRLQRRQLQQPRQSNKLFKEPRALQLRQ